MDIMILEDFYILRERAIPLPKVIVIFLVGFGLI
jgi:hypothetical protein